MDTVGGGGILSLSKREGGPKSGGVNIYERDEGGDEFGIGGLSLGAVLG